MKINIDAGHGSQTPGKRTPPVLTALDINKDGKTDIKKGEQYREHYANVGVATLLVEELKRCGFDVMQTGFNDADASDDPDTALSTRQTAIAKANCDYSISIHFNAYGDGASFNAAQGVGIYIHDKYINQSDKLASIVLKHLAGGTKQTNRGINKQNLAMCNCNAMDVKAAILCELAFMTNEYEATTMMANSAFWMECAQEICKGMCEYTGIKYMSEEEYATTRVDIKSSEKDIIWLQKGLTKCLTLPAVKMNFGVYDLATVINVCTYWYQLGWNKDLANTGKAAGSATCKALASGRTK